MKNSLKLVSVALMALFLQSCFVAKDYEAPEDIVQEDHFRTDQIPTDSLSMADWSWRELFTDSLLQGYIEKALTNNIDIRKAVQQIAAAEAFVKQGKAGFLPVLNADASATRNYPSKNGTQGMTMKGDHINIYQLGANLSWEADIWGKIRSQKRAFDASYLQTVAAHQAVKTELIARIATAYYQLMALDEQIDVTRETMEIRKRSMETTQALKEAGTGTITSTAVQQTEAQYLDAKAILIDLQTQSRILENTMSILMGDEPHRIERSDLRDQEITTEYRLGVPLQLLQNRPDVLAAEAGYRQAFELTNVAKAQLYPAFTIGLSGGLESIRLKKLFDGQSLTGSLLAGITAPIFNGRALKTNYEVSRLEQEQARLNYRDALIRASKEVSDALYDYQAATDKVEIRRNQRELLQNAVEDSQALLEAGYNNFSYLEVLTAQESVLNASLAVIDEHVAQLTSMVELYRALGGGWR